MHTNENPLLRAAKVVPIRAGIVRPAGDATTDATVYFTQLRDAEAGAAFWRHVSIGLALATGYIWYRGRPKKAKSK